MRIWSHPIVPNSYGLWWFNVGKTVINQPFGNGKHTTYLWWFGGWFLIYYCFTPHYILVYSGDITNWFMGIINQQTILSQILVVNTLHQIVWLWFSQVIFPSLLRFTIPSNLIVHLSQSNTIFWCWKKLLECCFPISDGSVKCLYPSNVSAEMLVIIISLIYSHSFW